MVIALLGACRDEQARDTPPPSSASTSTITVAPPASTEPAAPLPPPRRERLTLLAGGDVSYARLVGRMLLEQPDRRFFPKLTPWLSSADLRFANLEGPLSEQKGEVQSPGLPLVFTGPPIGADALAREGFDIVSTANNHAWDYGKRALIETLDNLDRVGVRHVGTGRDRAEAYRPTLVEKDGFRLAFLAVTDIWNQGQLSRHEGAEYVAEADEQRLAAAVRALREDPSVDAVAVSHHGGSEYMDEPLQRTQRILRAAIDAGADVVIGHHPHVTQGVEWRNGRPILYSLGNLLMRMHREHPWTELGFLARIVFHRGTPVTVEACPYRIFGVEVLPLAADPHRDLYERRFYDHLRVISKRVGGTEIGPVGDDGCAKLSPLPDAAKP